MSYDNISIVSIIYKTASPTNLIMILKDKHNRVILWGCEEKQGHITAELAYFAPSLSRRVISITNGEKTLKIALKDEVLKQNFASKAQHISFEVVD